MRNENVESNKKITASFFVVGLSLIVGAIFYFNASDFFLSKMFELRIAKQGTQLQETISLLKWYPSMFVLSIGSSFVFVSLSLGFIDWISDVIEMGWKGLSALMAKRVNNNEGK